MSRTPGPPPWPFRGSEAVNAGLVSWTVLQGPRFRRLAPDTYADADTPDDALMDLRAAVVWAGPNAVLTGWSACRALDVDVLPHPSPPTELAVPGRRLRPPSGVIVRRQRIPDDDIVEIDGLRATSPLRTAYDLATRSELTDAVVAADGLARSGRFCGEQLLAISGSNIGRRGNRRVAVVADLMDAGAQSPPETRTRLVLVRAGLPRPVTQYEVRGENAWVVATVDLAWPEYRLALEYDGRDHTLDDRRGRDLDRIENLRQAGWLVIVLTSRQLRQPHRIVARVREELLARRTP